jgi:hypothetical protein
MTCKALASLVILMSTIPLEPRSRRAAVAVDQAVVLNVQLAVKVVAVAVVVYLLPVVASVPHLLPLMALIFLVPTF